MRYSLCVLVCVAFAAETSQSAPARSSPVQLQETRDAEGHLVKTENAYVSQSGRRVLEGPQTEWFRRGKPRLRVEYHDGLMDGALIEWDEEGRKVREGHWLKGKESGTWIDWYPDGKKASECVYRHGKIVGKKRYWDWGFLPYHLSMEETYDQSGALVQRTTWYPSGGKRMQGAFRPRSAMELIAALAGKDPLAELRPLKHGKWTYWDASGKVVREGTWKDGKPWEGVCGVSSITPEESMSGPEVFGRYHEGKLIERLPLTGEGFLSPELFGCPMLQGQIGKGLPSPGRKSPQPSPVPGGSERKQEKRVHD